MIGYDEIKAITDQADWLYPPNDDRAGWWAERGIDYAGLTRFCAEDGEDSVDKVLPLVEDGVPPHLLIGAGLAMSTEIGFLLGWLAHEKARA